MCFNLYQPTGRLLSSNLKKKLNSRRSAKTGVFILGEAISVVLQFDNSALVILMLTVHNYSRPVRSPMLSVFKENQHSNLLFCNFTINSALTLHLYRVYLNRLHLLCAHFEPPAFRL